MGECWIVADIPDEDILGRDYPDADVMVLRIDSADARDRNARAVVERAAAQLDLFAQDENSRVILVTEYRKGQHYEEFVVELENALHERFPRCHAVVANRSIDNWILADIEALAGHFKYLKKKPQRIYEGENSEDAFKDLLVDAKKMDGKRRKELFEHVTLDDAKDYSDSLARLMKALNI